MGERSSWAITQLTTLTCWILALYASPCARSNHGLHMHSCARWTSSLYIEGSQDEQSIGSDIQQPEATHSYQNETWKKWLYQKGLINIYTNVQDRTESTCTTMIIQPQCSHSNTCSTSSWKEHEFHFMIPSWSSTQGKWYNRSCKTSAV